MLTLEPVFQDLKFRSEGSLYHAQRMTTLLSCTYVCALHTVVQKNGCKHDCTQLGLFTYYKGRCIRRYASRPGQRYFNKAE